MTYSFSDDFETGTLSATWSNETAAVSVTGSAAFAGSFGMRQAATTTLAGVASLSDATLPDGWDYADVTFRFRQVSHTTGNSPVITVQNRTGSDHFDLFVNYSADSKLWWDLLSSDNASANLTLNTWYKVRVVVFFGGSTWTARVWLDDVEQASISTTGKTASDVRTIHFGGFGPEENTRDYDNISVLLTDTDPVEAPTALVGSDSGTLTEAAADLSATATATDSGTLTETAVTSVTASASDSGTLAESATRVVMGELSWRFAIDWNNDGDFEGAGEDVTERVLASGGFSTSFGRDQARALAPPAAGRAAFTLNNQSGDYSPDRSDSPLADDLLPARPVQATVDLNGETHVLFRGHLDDYEVKVERNRHTVDATALDALADLNGVDISTPLYQGVRTGDAIGYLLDAVGWPADKRDLDPGATFIRWWWLHDADAWNALLELVASEGPGALVHADEQGRIVFRDRHHRLLGEGSTTGQAVITDGTGGWEPAFSAITYDHGWKDIVNAVSFTVEELDPSPDFEDVWTSEDNRNIDPSATLTLDIQANSPVRPGSLFLTYGFIGTVSHTVTQNTAQSITIEFTAGPSGATVNQLTVHGQMVTSRRSFTVEVEDAGSITKYGRRSPGSSIDAPWAGVHDALAIAQLLVGARAERLPTVQITMRGARINERLMEQVGRDLSDRVHITEQVTGIDTDFYLEQISHRVAPGGFLESEFGLEKAATQPSNVLRFDDPDYGFDDGVFGSAGLDDPANLLLFDVEGRGFDDGVFAT